jgi:hypothetical protein
MMLEIQVLAWDSHKNVAELKWLIGSQPSPLDKWISTDNTYTVKPTHAVTSIKQSPVL